MKVKIINGSGWYSHKVGDVVEVEVGAEVSISREYGNGLRSWFTATFKEYIPQTNQIIVFNNNKVEVYDESEVELCN